MCSRFVYQDFDLMWEHFLPERIPGYEGSCNIAPTDYTLVVRWYEGKLCMWPMRWGLIPGWAKDESNATRCINARVETITEKASFRGAVKYRRCVVPADGFYEWQGVKGYKQPYYIYRADGATLGMAGIWEEWESPAGTVETFSILTTDANREMSDIHSRMPVVLEERNFRMWMDQGVTDAEMVRGLMVPARDGTLAMHPVGKEVGNPRAEGEHLILRVGGSTLF